MQDVRIWLVSLIVLITASMYGVYQALDAGLMDKHYIFTPEKLHALALSSIEQHGNNTADLVATIIETLRADPNIAPYISTEEEWMFNNAGGAMGGMYMIHCSLTEYLLIFGTAVGTEGHSGRHTADDYFHIIQGTQVAYTPGSYEPEVYPQGSVHHLKRGVVKQYKMDSSCFALEYARGWIPGMMLFGYMDGLTSTMDWGTLIATTRRTGGEIIGNLLRGKI
ncbi:C-8 sterol isomerase [Vermiconidia calcicola]|uniref:C-8 sterol isomerase n=1 Tax=Vermiconidia calcicola TaxID=1690605 RepID=A0ACC3NW61_9PEZI|nr:C-8 sterol isomerase [Vermiconidia calcicola]